ncbi:MFS general substrate transporter [Punctularia strigosozonata HHB-11173 SS5]|uniref:MFS general substrate transporter n=1 Tax=Punctularia strigosozonata (strain HHB-11173) TaxID=741275 RepID=UPI00044163BA|nr:MFS general substrate transporter [Punctularia strigosozonata HHB-11173 SS5]EIN07491.1 MFS general substrate transporter [Punctularia strigosozonata HHB-11173 SS5]
MIFPEGGTVAWLTVTGAWLMQFCSFGLITAFGVYQDYYVRTYLSHNTNSQISWIGSFNLFIVLSLGLVTGRAFDNGYFHHLAIGGSVLIVFSLFMLSITHMNHYYQVFLAQGVGLGVGLGMVYVPSLGIAAHYFQRRRALMMGLVSSGAPIGGIIHPIMLNKLFNNPSIGFHTGVRVNAAMIAGLLLIANAFMRPRLVNKKTGAFVPASLLRQFATDTPYLLTVLSITLVLFGLFFPQFYIQLDAIEHHVDSTFAFYTVAIMNAASFVGRVVPSFIAHNFGVINMMLACTLACGVLIFAMLGVTGIGGTIAFSILYGFFSGSYIALFAPMCATLSSSFAEIGARMGVAYAVSGVAGLVGSPISGALLGSDPLRYRWWRPIVFSGVCVTAGGVLTIAIRTMVARRKNSHKV